MLCKTDDDTMYLSPHVWGSPALNLRPSEPIWTESSEAALGAAGEEKDKEDGEQAVDDELEGLLHADLRPERINDVNNLCALYDSRDRCSSHLDWELSVLRSAGGHHKWGHSLDRGEASLWDQNYNSTILVWNLNVILITL